MEITALVEKRFLPRKQLAIKPCLQRLGVMCSVAHSQDAEGYPEANKMGQDSESQASPALLHAKTRKVETAASC